MKKIIYCLLLFITLTIPTGVFAEDDIDQIVNGMTTEEKVAQMIMASFRWSDPSNSNASKVTEITPDIEAILNDYNFAGVIIFAQNVVDTEQTTRLIYELQTANANNPNSNGQLLIAIDQEGGYITRLAEGTIMPGNMGLGATNDPSLAYETGNIIGTELDAVGVNVDFAPVTDVNNNPANPVIGVRSFSDDPDQVGEYASEFMKGLQDANMSTALKHFPGHGDTSTDTHSDITSVDKSLDELLELELKPFQKLVNEGTDMIMTAHIVYPQIETSTFVSSLTTTPEQLPATLSEKIITDILRNQIGYNGVIITDALDMGAITKHFTRLEAATLAINAGVDILLMPVETNGTAAINDFRTYISDVAALVDNGTISMDKVNAAVKRVLTLKKNKGLLEPYSVNIDDKVANALKVVSTVENHEKEFEIAKQAITLVKNDNDALPISADDKTLFLYYYTSHVGSSNYALQRLINDGIITNKDNILFFDYDEEMDKIKEEIKDAKNVVILHAMYGLTGVSAFDSTLSSHIDEVLELCNQYGVRSIFVSAHLPYDISRFNDANSIVAAYLANGLSFDLLNYDTSKPIPKYGPNIIAAIYQLFDSNANLTGKLPVNIYKLDSNNSFTNEILYPRGHGLSYKKETNDNTDIIINPNTGDSIIINILLLVISMIVLINTFIYTKKLLND